MYKAYPAEIKDNITKIDGITFESETTVNSTAFDRNIKDIAIKKITVIKGTMKPIKVPATVVTPNAISTHAITGNILSLPTSFQVQE